MRTVVIKRLPDGRACVHFFVIDEAGPCKNPSKVVMTSAGPMTWTGATGRIACRPEQDSVLPQQRGNEFWLVCRSDDARAVTCPECMKTPEYLKMMTDLEAIMEHGNLGGVPA